MKIISIVPILIVALSVSCVPATRAVPSETSGSTSTLTLVPLSDTQTPPPSATIAPTPTPETIAPTSEPTGSLSADGPWLLYVHNSPRPRMPGSDSVPPEFILLNQDGSGRTPIALPYDFGQISAFLMEGENSANYVARYGDGLYLLQPSKAIGMMVYPTYKTFYNSDEKGGLLASFYRSAEDAAPELIIFELPSGTIRDRFPPVLWFENIRID